MLGAVGQCQVAQVGQVLEEQVDFKVLQLRDDQAEDFVASGVQFLNHLRGVPRRFEFLEQVLNVRLDIRLFETVSVLLSLNVLVLHFVAFQALLLPIELKVDIASGLGNSQLLIGQFHNFTLDVFICDISQLGVEVEILCDDFVR